MADLGNLKILLDMATTGNLKSTLENVDKRLDKMREKASALKLGFDEGSVSAVSTKMRDIAEAMQEVSRNAGAKMAEGMAKSAEAAKGTTTQMQQQVSISAELEALLKEMAGTIRAIADGQSQVTNAKRSAVAAAKEEESEEQKLYNIAELRRLAEDKVGELTKNEVAILGQMEQIEKRLVGLGQQYGTELTEVLIAEMERGGVSRQHLKTLETQVTRMEAAAKAAKQTSAEEQKAARQQEQYAKMYEGLLRRREKEEEQVRRKQKQAAKEREAAAKRQAQLETSIIRIETQLLGINEDRLSGENRLLVWKMRHRQITQEELSKLSAILAQEKAIENAERQKGAATVKTNTHLRTQSSLLQQITGYLGTYFSVMGAANLIKNLVRITGEFEAQRTALRAILQDVAGADRIFYQLQELAVKSPYTFRNLTDYAKQLSAFSVPMNDIYDTTKRLADVSAGLGVDMSRIILAYGQIRSASFLRGQEVRQLTEAGIPVLQELAKQFSEIEGQAVSVGKVFDKISARQVPFKMIEKMFKDLTSEGGKFYQMQEILADTVKGKVSNLQDAWEIMLSKVGESNSGFIKSVLNGLTNLISNYKTLGNVLKVAAVTYGVYRMAVIAVNAAHHVQALTLMTVNKQIGIGIALSRAFLLTLKRIPAAIASAVAKLGPIPLAIAAVSAAVTALAIHINNLGAHLREVHKMTAESIAKAEEQKSRIYYYVKRLKEAEEGTKEYNKARQAIIDQSGQFISATDAERLSLENIDQVWVNICNHIEEATKLKGIQTITETASEAKLERDKKAFKELRKLQEEYSDIITDDALTASYEYLRGEIDSKTFSDIIYRELKDKKDITKTYGDASLEESAYTFWTYRTEEAKKALDKSKKIYQETIDEAYKDYGLYHGTGKPDQGLKGTPLPLTGWRANVQKYLKPFNGAAHGVDEDNLAETGLADLAKQGKEKLDDLRKQLDLIPENEEDYKPVKKEEKFWMGLSEAIYGKGKTEFGNSTKLYKKNIKDAETLRKEQIAAIKQSVQDLKEAKRWYDQLAPLLGEDNAKTLLASYNFAVPKEGFNAAFQGYADQLKKLGDENGARDVMNWANGRDIGDVVEAYKAIEKYNEALQDLQAQTKRLNLSGLAQELDKIIVDADSKNRQLETDWAQKSKELEKAKDGWIQEYRLKNEKATAGEAEKAWDDFYKAQVKMAEKSIDTQREYNKKVAQEQINDKASKWVEEMMKENNINLNDMGDKSLGQMNVIIERLRALVTEDALANLIPDELKEDAKMLNVTFKELLGNIEKVVNTKIGDVQVDRMKKLLKGISSGLGELHISVNTDAVQDAYAEYVEAVREEEEAKNEFAEAQKEYQEALLRNQDYSALLKKIADAHKKAKKAAEAHADAENKLRFAAIIAGAQAFASALSQVGEKVAEIGSAKGDNSLKDLGNTLNVVGGAFQSALAGFAVGGPIGAAVGAGLSLVRSFTDSIAKAAAYTREMRQASADWALAVMQVRNEYALLQEQFDTIFGSSTMSKMSGWAQIIREQSAAIREFYKGESSDISGWANLVLGNAGLNKNIAGLAEYKIKTQDYNAIRNFFGKKDKYTKVADLVPELFNKDGSLNFDYLDEFKSSKYWDKLSDDWKNTLNEMAEANKAFESACDEMKNYLTSIFGEVGSTISDQLISAFESTGEVALDTGDILSDVAKKFLSDWTQAFLMKNYLGGLGDTITDIWEDGSLSMEEQVSQSLGLLRDSLTAMSDRLPEIQAFYEGMEDQFHWADGAGEELGDAVKTALVEQNSSLIAGYLNTMRADITMQRDEIMRNISPAVTSISNGFNTHLMYMESVAGNVSNIWNRINLLTSPGSGVKLNARI